MPLQENTVLTAVQPPELGEKAFLLFKLLTLWHFFLLAGAGPYTLSSFAQSLCTHSSPPPEHFAELTPPDHRSLSATVSLTKGGSLTALHTLSRAFLLHPSQNSLLPQDRTACSFVFFFNNGLIKVAPTPLPTQHSARYTKVLHFGRDGGFDPEVLLLGINTSGR